MYTLEFVIILSMKRIANRIKHYFEGIDFHFFIEVIIAVCTLITSIKACDIADKQNQLVNEQLEVQKQDKLPLFEIHSEILKVDSSNIHDTEVLKIYNVREATKGFCKIDIKTFYEVSRHKGTSNDTIYVPIKYYFAAQTEVKACKGQLTMAFGPSNNAYYFNFYKECMAHSNSLSQLYYFSRYVHLISIKYNDIFDQSHQSYFINEIEVTFDEYNAIIDKAKKVFSYQEFPVDTIKLSDLECYFNN